MTTAERDETELKPCDTCQGTGEVVTDWEGYLHPPTEAPGDFGTAECPDCDGTGYIASAIAAWNKRAAS